ncbi:hypothetical protein BASA50_007094 [Batrachochytrium salamandrivorans]|uniref:Uncharacterized protein n=1 Tax=Batrachochytrium salamandrivorans TaxID=1357716 RepID=A0ABQ8F882_9FUNG|nr:hypothetical protein BASA50_007094 [Batrachochytrium salamandrivorans]
MKFNVLVIAAMVITSVSAGKRKGLLSWFRYDGRKSKSGEHERLINDGSGSLETHDPPTNPSSMSQAIDLANKKTTCDNIEAKLSKLYSKLNLFDSLFRKQMRDLYMIMGGDIGKRFRKTENGVRTEVTQRSNENETRESRHRKVQDWFKSHPEDQLEVEEMRKDLTDWLGEHLTLWTEFLEIGCSIYGVDRLSPEKVLSRMSLVRWHTETTQSQETTQAQETNEINLITF